MDFEKISLFSGNSFTVSPFFLCEPNTRATASPYAISDWKPHLKMAHTNKDSDMKFKGLCEIQKRMWFFNYKNHNENVRINVRYSGREVIHGALLTKQILCSGHCVYSWWYNWHKSRTILSSNKWKCRQFLVLSWQSAVRNIIFLVCTSNDSEGSSRTSTCEKCCNDYIYSSQFWRKQII